MFRNNLRLLIIAAFCLLTLGCGVRFDMQDQPRYKAYKKSDFFSDKRASRDMPEGSVARGQLHATQAGRSSAALSWKMFLARR